MLVAATMFVGYRCHYIKHFIQEKNSYITDKGWIQHIRKTHPQIDSCIADEGEGFNTLRQQHVYKPSRTGSAVLLKNDGIKKKKEKKR